jgi:hypothetical protein
MELSMKMNLGLRGMMAFVLALVCLPGCGQKEALDFNNKIANANQRLASAGEPFGRAVGPTLAGAPADLAEVHRTYKAMQDTLASIKTESQAWKIPPGDPAKNFFASHQRFLKIEEEGIADYGELVKALENLKLTPQQKGDRARSLLLKNDEREKAALADLQATQLAFGKAHNIKILPPPPGGK